ncbi:MAG: histidine kinase [Caulobacter sp.]|nr:histidine kinase [Caulobacter sp.]
MEPLLSLIDRRDPVAPDTPCQVVLAGFQADPHAPATAVVDARGAPIGLVYRDVFLGMMQVAGDALAQTPIAEVMDAAPRIVPATTHAGDFIDSLEELQSPVFRTAFVAVDEAGGYVGVGGLSSLLASHRRRHRDAREAMALVERMAHDIGQHLDGVLNFTERLGAQRLSPDAAAYVRAISETSGDIRGMLGRAMDLHHSAAGGLPLAPRPHRLRELADAIDARWSIKAVESGATLLFSYDGDPDGAVLVDADRIMQVFDALIDSALSSGRGLIEAVLCARRVEGGLKLEGRVRDNAPGSAEERLARVFDPLGDGRIADRSEMALGVGMALAHRIAKAMGGVLKAEANRGAGLTITFSTVVPEALIGDDSEDAPSMRGRAAHILIVDDNATNRMVAEALCELFDCTSEQVNDGVEAVDAARNGRFDLILMDIKMPRMDGVAATREIRLLSGKPGQVPIIALTANADPEDAAGYLKAGMNGVVEKPMKPETLLRALQDNLGGAEGTAAAA